MHILMVSDVYFPRINGVSTSIRTFRDELVNLGHEVSLVAPEYTANHKTQDWIYRIPSFYLPMDPEDRMLRRRYVRALYPVLRHKHIDIIHVQTPFMAHNTGRELAKKLSVPVVESYHTHFEACLHHYLPYMPRTLTRTTARWFNRRR